MATGKARASTDKAAQKRDHDLPNELGLISVRRAAEILGIGETLMWKLIRTRQIASCKVGAKTRVREADVRAHVVDQFAS